MGGALSRIVEPPPDPHPEPAGSEAAVATTDQSGPPSGTPARVGVRMRSASGRSDVLLLPSTFARHAADHPRREPQASPSSYFELDRVARLSPHLLQHIAGYLSVPHEEAEAFLRHFERAFEPHPGAHLLTNPLEYLLRPHCCNSVDAFLSFFFANVQLRGPSNITQAMERRTPAREAEWLVEGFVARALHARFLVRAEEMESGNEPPAPPECLLDEESSSSTVFARYFPHCVGTVMGLRARSDADQIARRKLDAKERDALRVQLCRALELMLPDLHDSKVHEVLASHTAGDGPPTAASEPSGESDPASESEYSGQYSDDPAPIHDPSEEMKGVSKGKGKQKAEKDPKEQFEDHLAAVVMPRVRQQLCELWRRDLAELQRFGWLDAPTFDKVPTCPHERQLADYSNFLRAREPLVVGQWPLVASESTSQLGPSRSRDSPPSKPLSAGPSLTPAAPHDVVWVDVEPRQPWTGLGAHPVLWRLGAKFVDVPYLPELGCDCDACREKWMLADFLTQLPLLRSAPWPTYDAETTAAWAGYHVGAAKRALAAGLKVDPSGADPSAYQPRSAEQAAIEGYATEIARRVFATYGAEGAEQWLYIGAWLRVRLGIWEEGGRTYTGTASERVEDLLLAVLWGSQCMASGGGMLQPAHDIQPAEDLDQPAEDFDQVIALRSAEAGDTAPSAPKRPDGYVYVTKQRKLWAQRPRKPLPKNAVARLASQEAAAKAATAAAAAASANVPAGKVVGRSKTAAAKPTTANAPARSNGVSEVVPGSVVKPVNGTTINGEAANGKSINGRPVNGNSKPVNGKPVNCKPANGKSANKSADNIFRHCCTPPNGPVDALFPDPPDPIAPAVHAKVVAMAELHQALTALPPEERTEERTAYLFERARLQASASGREAAQPMMNSTAAPAAVESSPVHAPAPRQVRPDVAREVVPEAVRQPGLTGLWMAIRREIESKLGRPLTQDDMEEIHLRAGEAAQRACWDWIEEKLTEEKAKLEQKDEVGQEVAEREAEAKAARDAEETADREAKERLEREQREREEEAQRQRQQEEEQRRRQRQVARDMERQKPNKKKAKAKRRK